MIQAPVQLQNPFPGLRPFNIDEEHLFFGREGQADELLIRLQRTRFLAVVGISGSGKSSLVWAGLLSALESGFLAGASSSWRVAIMRPGEAPIQYLAEALNQANVLGVAGSEAQLRTIWTETTLRRGALGLVEAVQEAQLPPAENVLVVVDQFEELFRFKERLQEEGVAGEAAAFVKLLLAAVQQREMPIYVVLTMRSDFLGDCAQFRDLPEAINEGQYLIPRMTREQLRSAIEGPVAVGYGQIAPRLVNRLLNDVGDNLDQLPLLQHALMRSWEFWQQDPGTGDEIDLEQYETIGGMAAALSQHADEIYEQLPDEQARQIAETLFKCLTEKGADNRGIRRPTQLGKICAVAQTDAGSVMAVVEAFRGQGKSFVMPPVGVTLTEETVLDISHESLMRVWRRLKDWVEAEAQSAQTYRRLADTACRHQVGATAFLQNPELTLVQNWQKENQPNAVWAQRYDPNFDLAMQFLDASAAAVEETERRQKRQRRLVTAGLSAGLVLTTGLAGFAISQLWRAEQQQMRQHEATSKLLVQKEPYKSLVNAIVAIGLGKSFIVKFPYLDRADLVPEEILLQPSNQVRGKSLKGHQAGVLSVAFSPDGQTIVSGSDDRTVRLWDLEGTPIGKPFKGHEKWVSSVAFSSDGKTIVSGSGDRTVRLWDLEGNSIGQPFQGHGAGVSSVAFSPDGQTIVSGSYDRTVRLWDLEGNPIGQPFQGHGAGVSSVAFSPDGQTIVSGSDDSTVRLWDLEGTPIGQPFQGHGAGVSSVAFSPDGKTIVSGSDDRTVRLWDLEGNSIGQPFQGHGAGVSSVAFSDGKTIISGSDDDTVRLWDLEGNPIGQPFQGHENWVRSVAFNPNGKTIVSGSDDRTVRLWDLEGTPIGQPFQGHENWVSSVAFSSDGKIIVSGSGDSTVRRWDLEGTPIGQLFQGHEAEVRSVAFSPDGKTIVSGGDGRTVHLWDLEGNPIGQPFQGHQAEVRSVAFSFDGKTIVSGSDDRTVRLWDLQGNSIGQPFQGHQAGVSSVAFSPDGKTIPDGQTIVSGSDDRTVRLWDLEGNPIGKPFQGHEAGVSSVAFSPDGKTIVSGSDDRTVRLWDLEGNPIGQPFRGHEAGVSSVAFSPDGQTIVSGSDDSTVRLWNLEGTPIGQPFRGHQAGVSSVAFSPDGKTIVSGSSDRTVRLWKQWPWKGWLPFACNRISRSDRSFDVASKAIDTCQRHVWSKRDSE